MKSFYFPAISEEMPEIKDVLQKIIEELKVKCQPLPSMPDAYNDDQNFQSNVEFRKIKAELDRKALPFIFSKQMVNFETKVIGCLAVNPAVQTDTIYIPCLPSALDTSLPYSFIGDPRWWGPYADTVQKLMLIYTRSLQVIPCKPVVKVVSDNVIVGLLTITNQFVPCIPEPFQESPTDEEADQLQVLYMKSQNKNLNFLKNDQMQLLDHSIDQERLKTIKQIHLESHFYNTFRNLLRILLTYYENKTQKDELLDHINSITTSYPEKLTGTKTALEGLMKRYVEFTEYPSDTIQDIENIHQCLNLSPTMCGKKSYCVLSNDDGQRCTLQVPKINLINGADNEIQYFGRLADELIRYARIKTFIFNPESFYHFKR